MNEKLSYSGVVTLLHRVNNKVVYEKHYNNGTLNLFEAYARALCGQSITRFIPKRIDVGLVGDNNVFNTRVKPGVSIPVVIAYKSGGTDGGKYIDGKYDTDVPYCRVSTTLSADMFENIDSASNLTVILKSAGGLDIAVVEVSGLAEAINDANAGIQLLLVWDLYVTNSSTEESNESAGNE